MQFTIIAIIDLPSKRELRTIDLDSVYDHHLLIDLPPNHISFNIISNSTYLCN